MNTFETLELPAQIHLIGRESRNSDYRRFLKLIKPPHRFLFQATLSGSGRVRMGREVYAVGKNQALFLPAPSSYIYESGERWDFIHLSLKSSWATQVAKQIHDHSGPVLTLPEGSRTMKVAMESLGRHAVSGRMSPFESSSLACRFLLTLLEEISNPVHESLPRYIESALQHIRRNLEKPLSVMDMSARLGVSREYFTREFTRCMKMPPSRYIWGIRVLEGASLLTHSNLTIREIAKRTGFGDALAFTRAFRRRFQKNPKEWRDMGSV